MTNDISDEIDIGFPLVVLWFGLLVGLVIGWNLCMNFIEYSERVEYQCNGKYATLHIRVENGKVSHKLEGCKEDKTP